MIPNRRQLLKTLIGSIATSTFLSSTSIGQPQTEHSCGELPQDVSNPGEVRLPRPIVQSNPITSDQWIVHRFGWKTTGNEQAGKLVEFQNKTEYTFQIDGKPVSNPSDYWSKIEPTEDDQWRVTWKYATPPMSPGEHTFTVTYQISEPYHSLIHNGETHTLTGSEELTREYQVLTPTEAQRRAIQESARTIAWDIDKVENIRDEFQAVRSLHLSQRDVNKDTLGDVVSSFCYYPGEESPSKDIHTLEGRSTIRLQSLEEVNQAIDKLTAKLTDLRAKQKQLREQMRILEENSGAELTK